MDRKAFRVALIAVLLKGLAATPTALAADPPCRQFQPAYGASSPRVDELTIEGHRVFVLKPRAYQQSGRSYPVVYLLHGGLSTPDEWLARLDLEALTAELELIVVMPAGGSGGFYTDWRHDPQGLNQWESFHIRRLIPFIDGTYRTRADRAHRAVAGLSMGGFGAIRYAARHPGLFTAAGSFSGILDTNATGAVRLLTTLSPVVSPCFEGRVENLDDRWGPRAADEVWWRDSNPPDLAANLHGVNVFTRVATGEPCDADDVLEGAQSDPTAFTVEPDAREQTLSFRRALDREAIAHDSATYGCGIHTYRHFAPSLRDFLPWLIARFGAAPPRRFSYRSAAPRFAAWGWSFTTSEERAPEFLDVRDASPEGFVMTGTGGVGVLTAPMFRPRQRVTVHGADEAPRILRATRRGRLRLSVDLGAPSEVQQYTAAHAQLGRPRVTRTVSFRVGTR